MRSWLALLLLVPWALAQPALDISASIMVDGPVAVASLESGEMLVSGAHMVAGQGNWQVEAESVSWRLYNAPVEIVRTKPTPHTPAVEWQVRELGTSLVDERTFTGTIRVVSTEGHPWVNWELSAPGDIAVRNARLALEAPAPFGPRGLDPDPVPQPSGEFFVRPDGRGAYAASDSPLSLPAVGRHVFYQAQLEVVEQGATSQVKTGDALNASQSIDTPLAGRFVYDRHFLVLDGMTSVELQGAASQWAVTGLRGRGYADLLLRDVRGHYLLNGENHSLERDVLQAIGLFDVQAQLDADQATWTVAGQGEFVGINGQTIAGERPGTPVLAAGIVMGGAGAILAFLLARSKAFDHATRMRLLAYIHAEPAITRMELAKCVGVGRSVVRYHLACLERQGLISELEAGRNPAYVLHVIVADGLASRSALAALGHETRRAILKASAQGIDYASFAEEYPISPAGFSKQCQALAAVGLLRRHRERGRIVWHAQVTLEAIRETLGHAFGQKHPDKARFIQQAELLPE